MSLTCNVLGQTNALCSTGTGILATAHTGASSYRTGRERALDDACRCSDIDLHKHKTMGNGHRGVQRYSDSQASGLTAVNGRPEARKKNLKTR